MNHRKNQAGIAIITVLLMVALSSISVVAMVSRQQLDIRRAYNQQSLQQARAFAVAGEKFAAAVLMRDISSALTGKTDSLDDDWAQSLPPVPIDQSTVKGCVFDMQGRFNLNNLVDNSGKVVPGYLQILTNLLTELNIDASKAAAIVDWIDDDSEEQGADGAEGSHYSSLDPPYRAANRPLLSVSELKQVKGFSPAVESEREDYRLLLPHVAALPETGTLININTATPMVIAALDKKLKEKSDDLSRWPDTSWEKYPECSGIFDIEKLTKGAASSNQDASTSAKVADKEVFEEVGAFISEAELVEKEDLKRISALITIKSSYFQIHIDVASGEIVLTQYSLVKRGDDGASKVLTRTRSVF